jgi:hypothetical protein
MHHLELPGFWALSITWYSKKLENQYFRQYKTMDKVKNSINL